MIEEFPDATNLQYVNPGDDVVVKKVFLSHVNSYHGGALAKKILSQNADPEIMQSGHEMGNVNQKVGHELYGTCDEKEEEEDVVLPSGCKIVDSNSDDFFPSILACDFIILDISQDFSQLTMARKFLKYFEDELENSRVAEKKNLILLSTIMTWMETPPTSEVLSDTNYRKRRPHPCFVNHMLLESEVIKLGRKYSELVSSVVVCPGIIYGGHQDVFRFLFKKCYFNNTPIDIFAPATNLLPLVYIEDFTRIMMLIIGIFPEATVPYVLAVQPESLSAIKIAEVFAEAAGGPESLVKMRSPNEIFLMNEELMTVRKV